MATVTPVAASRCSSTGQGLPELASGTAARAIPSRGRNWLAAVTRAAAALKPTMTGAPMKFTSTPARSRPKRIHPTPTIMARV